MDFHNHLFDLPKNLEIHTGRQEFVIHYASNRKVLHLGCVDEGLIEEKFRQGLLLHDRLSKVTRELWGVDIDPAGIEWLAGHGYPHVFLADIEQLGGLPEIMTQDFDLILLTEVLEHLDNPGKFLQALRPLMRPGTELLITVPNAWSLTALLEAWQGRELVHPDHNYWFSYRTVTSLLSKFGYQVVHVLGYTQYDYHRSILAPLWRKLGLHRAATPPAAVDKPQAAASIPAPAANPNLGGWLRMARTRLLYRSILRRSPFFADGLIFIVRAVDA